jgi:hypothetical protein
MNGESIERAREGYAIMGLFLVAKAGSRRRDARLPGPSSLGFYSRSYPADIFRVSCALMEKNL